MLDRFSSLMTVLGSVPHRLISERQTYATALERCAEEDENERERILEAQSRSRYARPFLAEASSLRWSGGAGATRGMLFLFSSCMYSFSARLIRPNYVERRHRLIGAGGRSSIWLRFLVGASRKECRNAHQRSLGK